MIRTRLQWSLFGIGILLLCIGDIQARGQTCVDPEVVYSYLHTEKGSPLQSYVNIFLDAGTQWDVDPRVLIAISGQESNFDKASSTCDTRHNPFSWNKAHGCVNPKTDKPYTSLTDAINNVSQGVGTGYLGAGHVSFQGFYDHGYCVSNCGDWVGAVTGFYQALGGDPGDLFDDNGDCCFGDCHHDGQVTIDELITGVLIALGQRPLSDCWQMVDAATHQVTILELLRAILADFSTLCPPYVCNWLNTGCLE